MSDAEGPTPASHRQLEALLERYAGLIRRVVSSVAGSGLGGAQDDIAQDVVVNLWRQLEREQTIEHPASYIYRAAVRETVRAVQRARSREQAAGDALDLAPHAITEETPESRLARRQRAEVLVSAIARLQPDRRRAVQAHLAGYDVAEIMRLFGWPYQRARNLVSRGMADLRGLLNDEGIRG